MPEPRDVSGYGLELPSAESMRAALTRMVGAEEADRRWLRACHAVQAPWPAEALEVGKLRAIAEYLSHEMDVVSVVGCSMLIRINAYQGIRRKLSAEEGNL